MAKILIFDIYDSFTYNLVHIVRSACNHDIDVVLNDGLPGTIDAGSITLGRWILDLCLIVLLSRLLIKMDISWH